MATKKITSASQEKTLKDMSIADLRIILAVAQKEQYILHMRHTLGELKQPHLLTRNRKYIAKISTYITSAN